MKKSPTSRASEEERGGINQKGKFRRILDFDD